MTKNTENVYEINNWKQLQNVNNDLTASYMLTANIIFPALGKCDFNGFSPIKGADPFNNTADRFTGSFDGKGFTINNLHIDTNEDYVGLFGYVDGSVSNLGLINNSVKGKIYVGGLVGLNRGTISGYATGNVSGTDIAGGLVGWNGNGGTLSGYATGNASGRNSVGGLAGINDGTISGYATGNVSGTQIIGGLTGQNNGTINGYATGNVSGTQAVGGLAGYNNGGTISGYATGNISGTIFVSGLTGTNIGAGTVSGYWDITSTNQMTSAGGVGTIGITSINNVVASEKTPPTDPKTYTYNDTKGTTNTADDMLVFNNTVFIQYFELPTQSYKWPKLTKEKLGGSQNLYDAQTAIVGW